MSQDLQNRVGNLILTLSRVDALVEHTLQDDEILEQFGCRGIQKKDLQVLAESLRRVSEVWYNPPRPV